jgi:hypothetical protein
MPSIWASGDSIEFLYSLVIKRAIPLARVENVAPFDASNALYGRRDIIPSSSGDTENEQPKERKRSEKKVLAQAGESCYD